MGPFMSRISCQRPPSGSPGVRWSVRWPSWYSNYTNIIMTHFETNLNCLSQIKILMINPDCVKNVEMFDCVWLTYLGLSQKNGQWSELKWNWREKCWHFLQCAAVCIFVVCGCVCVSVCAGSSWRSLCCSRSSQVNSDFNIKLTRSENLLPLSSCFIFPCFYWCSCLFCLRELTFSVLTVFSVVTHITRLVKMPVVI